MDEKGFFQDPYGGPSINPKDDRPVTVEELTALMQSIHELNSKADELLDKEEYSDALPYLLESYERLTEFQYSPLSEEVMPAEEHTAWMAWVCHRISFCYVEAGDYISAFYYIDMVKGVSAYCFMEWINVLVNSRRMDALSFVEDYVEDPDQLDSLWDIDKEKKTVMDFLERRLGYLYIEYGEYAKARELFTRMLDNPDSRKFAQEELDYLESL